jgi:imidazoleglycerol-phosphate dehydratase
MQTHRTSQIERKTAETQIELKINLDGTGKHSIQTGVGFLDHMLVLFSKHSLIDLEIHAAGDLHIDAHHTTEDVGICLGQALRDCLGDKSGIRRYGHIVLPMEETLVTTAVDFSGRSYLVFNAPMPSPKIGDFDSELVEDFWQAFANNAQCNLSTSSCITGEIRTISPKRSSNPPRVRSETLSKSIRVNRVSQAPKESFKCFDALNTY